MKKLLLATAATALFAGAASAEDVKLGVLIGFTGPIESLTPNMLASSKMAVDEVNASKLFLDGSTLTVVEADSTCTDSAAATSAAERLVTTDGVAGIVGGDCSGVTGAVLQNVARPNGIAMISPSATSPALSTAEDDGLFFRTAPSDAREGEVMAGILMEKGLKSVALTYTNTDYGKGLAEAFATSYTALGGTITINAAHEDGKADYSAEVGALAAAGGDILVVAGYLDQGGKGIIQGSLDSGAFDKFVLPGGMVGDSLPAAIGPGLNGSFGQIAGSDSAGAATFEAKAKELGFDGTSAYSPESYDAAALFALAMQAAKSSKSADYAGKILEVANAPGEKIYPGELAKGLQLILDGQDVDFEGATAVELIGPGESAGRYREIEIKDGKIETIGFR
ncbi:branched-chain amino acid ABC transporter substrate-binding protein [Gemmobacter aquarius]|uniref:Branched-chain amino acid ABC transporter substrate-binding protein n=1 Tax=Paragemmobacter aquarius TaxID=2169400 RepID=A0A2S0ULE6_9RHOB|nr:ABC transporter substrate-binding protein [Gemmobacter aquarius]AWB48649.1 branched-chain amino acid ABC transporter substrate-binding protein [Gemmobacter aquarius]